MTPISERLHQINALIRTTAEDVGRDPEGIRLVAVGKRHPAAAIRAAAEAGQRDFGENYVREGLDKMRELADLDLCWHYIGPLQSNKTRDVAEHYDWMHTIDRFKIARRLSEQRPEALPPLQACIQVNISREPQKAGVAPERVDALAERVAQLPGLRLRGLMCLPAPAGDEAARREPFRRMRELLEHLNRQGHELDTLSMGMTADLAEAVAEGSTIVRVGTAIFGPRG